MSAINLIATVFSILSGISLLTGLFYKPWVVLWWMEKQNRIKVILYYGSTLLVSVLIKFLTN